MTQPYNLSGISGSQTLFELVSATNTLTGDLMGTLIVVVTFVIAFISFKAGYDGKRSLAGASFITALISIFVRILGLTTDRVMFVTFIIAGVSLVILRWSD